MIFPVASFSTMAFLQLPVRPQRLGATEDVGDLLVIDCCRARLYERRRVSSRSSALSVALFIA